MKVPVALSGLAAGVLLGGLALAQNTTPTTPTGSPSAQSASDTSLGRHTMTGEVTSVSPDQGRLHVKTPEGRMRLHFPPSVLQSVKKGDNVTIELALKDNGPAPKTPKAR